MNKTNKQTNKQMGLTAHKIIVRAVATLYLISCVAHSTGVLAVPGLLPGDAV